MVNFAEITGSEGDKNLDMMQLIVIFARWHGLPCLVLPGL